MRIESIKRRVDELRAKAIGEPSYSLVELPDGTEREVLTQEWFDKRHEMGWKWKRFTKGHDPTFHNLDLVISTLFEECDMPEQAEAWAKGKHTD